MEPLVAAGWWSVWRVPMAFLVGLLPDLPERREWGALEPQPKLEYRQLPDLPEQALRSGRALRSGQ
ncbi:hypothetical protein CDA63_17900 [Hymenobacter amundsenii]|uniref:Uncharacterized protein n=1 Tax=Hymenobacter amundsenii TaxID=2006685 RepID=A0A246FJF8_9BACT|nr:hypothetical protein CDA63_17900 [Hymenobacter amundsenii]